MPSTFFGLTIAASGMNAYQVALNTSAQNISNSQTVGYSRQQANRVASDALRAHAAYGSMGTGVTTTSIKQVRNLYYDEKYWYNQSSLGLYETRLEYLMQIENYFIDDEDKTQEGFTTILGDMFNNLDSLGDGAGDVSTRQQFIGSAQKLCAYFNSVANGLSDIQNSANEEIKSTVENINSIAEKIALLNQQINVIEVQGGYANELRDQRALLVDELSKIVPIEAKEAPVTNSNYPDMKTGGSYYTVKIDGQVLVDTFEYNTLVCVARENKINQSDNDGLYQIKWEKAGNSFYAGNPGMSGSLKALFDIRDGNNGENFRGVARVEDGSTIKVVSPSLDTVELMTMPERGLLTINGKDYKYDGFTIEKDEDGNVVSYTFNLEEGLSVEERMKVDGMRAQIGSSVDSMGIPYYMAQMNTFLRSFCEKFNDILKKGEDLDGVATDYYAFFTAADGVTGEEHVFGEEATDCNKDSYYKLTALNICVSSVVTKNPAKLGTTVHDLESIGVDAYDIIDELEKLKNGVVLYRGGTAEDFLKCITSDISVDAQESDIFYTNYLNITNAIQTQRMSISGVDQDEEALDLIKFQNAYNLSSKMISVMAEVYDRLITQTGV